MNHFYLCLAVQPDGQLVLRSQVGPTHCVEVPILTLIAYTPQSPF